MINQDFHKKQQIQYLIKGSLNQNTQGLNLNKLTIWRDVLQYKKWDKLKFLFIDYCIIKDVDVEIMVVMSTQWENLQKLKIQYCKIESIGANLLWRINCPKLSEFRICGNNFTWLGLQQMSTSNLTSQLKVLDLSDNPIGCRGIKIVNKANLSRLQEFYAHKCEISNQGLAHLAKANWAKLTKLDINKNEITNQGILSMPNFNLPVAAFLTFLLTNSSVDLAHLVAGNMPRKCGAQACNNPDKSIRTGINNILKVRVNILFDSSDWQDDSLSDDSFFSSSSSSD